MAIKSHGIDLWYFSYISFKHTHLPLCVQTYRDILLLQILLITTDIATESDAFCISRLFGKSDHMTFRLDLNRVCPRICPQR